MHKLIIFSALIACALASWAPSTRHQEHPKGQHQPIASHEAKLGHAEHAVGGVSRGRDVGTTHGQLETVHHGGGTVFPNKQFRRIKKGQHNKHVEGNKGRNHLRRAHSRKHYRQ